MKKFFNYFINILSFCLFFASFWAIDTYGNFSGDELFFHLLVPLGGISLQSFSNLFTAVFLPGITIGLIITFLVNKRFPQKSHLITTIIFISLLVFSLGKINMFTYLSDQLATSTFIENNYIETKDIQITFPEKKKNLIYIFLESMENTYADTTNGGSRKENLIPNLTKLNKENTSFSNTNKLGGALSINGTNWTAASMVGQTSGLPLKINTSSNGIIDLSNFFPNTETLGDILKQNGYNNYLLLGSDSTYGCRKDYFEKHGSYKIFDLTTAIEQNKMTQEDIVWWGFDDTDLYKYAKEQLTEIAKQDVPFNYTMLTVDTHFEDGYLSSDCKTPYKDQYSNVINCADTKLSSFITWLQDQAFYKDTVIILVGDHPSMDSDYFDIKKDYIRTTYNVIINSETKANKTTNRKFTSLDMFPTTLAALGATIDGDKLALGTNLYSTKKTLIETYDYDYAFRELNKRSKFYNNKIMAYK